MPSGAEAAGTEGDRSSGLVILVAEDSPTQAEYVRTALVEAGHTVAVAPDGFAALARARAGDVQLVLADVEMPGLDGFELCRRLKDDPDLRRIPVVILTHRDRVTDVIRALEVGADNYLIKPFPAEELTARVARLLDEVQAWRQRAQRHRHRLAAQTEELVLTFERTQVVEMLMGAAEKLESELSTVGDISLGLTMDQSLDELLGMIAGRTRELAEATAVGVALCDQPGVCRFEAISGGAATLRSALAELLAVEDLGLDAGALVGRMPVLLQADDDDASDLVRALAANGSTTTTLIVPLVVAGRVLGLLALFFAVRRFLAGDELRRYRTLGDQAAVAIENARLFERERNSVTELRAVLDAASDAIVVVDHEGRFTDSNPAALALLGLPGEALPGADQALPAETSALFREIVGAVATDRIKQGAASLVRVDGTRRDVEYHASADVLPGRHLVVLHDLTERKSLEARLFQAQRLESVGRLAGGIAHDFNNLLNAIGGFAELARGDMGSDDPHRSDIDEVVRAADRATQLTRQLLSFSRHQTLKPEVGRLDRIIDEVTPLLGRLVGGDVELVVRTDPSGPAVRVDPAQLEQVIINLVVNARDAMPRGGRVTIEAGRVVLDEASRVREDSPPPGRYALLSVADTGIGMDPETRDQIFEPFFTTKPHGKGTGLGLSTAYGFVTQSGGQIQVRTEPGVGSTFEILLPEVADTTESVAAPAAQATPVRGTETILLVDDDGGGRAYMTRVLESYGYTVVPAANGDDALLAAADHAGPIDLLLTDLLMPGMSGRELADRLQAERPGVPTLYVSGYAESLASDIAGLGPTAPFLSKPFGPKELAGEVRRVIEGA